MATIAAIAGIVTAAYGAYSTNEQNKRAKEAHNAQMSAYNQGATPYLNEALQPAFQYFVGEILRNYSRGYGAKGEGAKYAPKNRYKSGIEKKKNTFGANQRRMADQRMAGPYGSGNVFGGGFGGAGGGGFGSGMVSGGVNDELKALFDGMDENQKKEFAQRMVAQNQARAGQSRPVGGYGTGSTGPTINMGSMNAYTGMGDFRDYTSAQNRFNSEAENLGLDPSGQQAPGPAGELGANTQVLQGNAYDTQMVMNPATFNNLLNMVSGIWSPSAYNYNASGWDFAGGINSST